MFGFIDRRTFAPGEFVRVSDGTVKTNRDLSVEFVDAIAIPQRDLDSAILKLAQLFQT